MLSVPPNRVDKFARMRSEVRRCTNNLVQEVNQHHADCAEENQSVALDLVDKISARIGKDNAVEAKRFLRHNLWATRIALQENADGNVDADVRQALEDARNSCLDISWTKEMRKYPNGGFVVGPKPSPSDIPNFERVNENFLRGGQPDQAGIQWLRDQGVKTILDLRGGDRENAWVEVDRSGVSVEEIDIPDFHPPTFEQVKNAIEILNNPDNHPVFVHCKAGVGRTGTITACWRVANGESAENALQKERINSYYGSLRQEDFVRQFETYMKDSPTKGGDTCDDGVCHNPQKSAGELWPLIHAYSDVTKGRPLSQILATRDVAQSDQDCVKDFASFWRE